MLKPAYEAHRDASKYRADQGLTSAANAALVSGQPLLLTGEPGTGKTRFAFPLARELALGEPLECLVTCATTSKDLLYSFDELARFRDSHRDARRSLKDYLTFNGLGTGILKAGGRHAELEPLAGQKGTPDYVTFADLLPEVSIPQRGHVRSAVLIDELDKAPRDTPNTLVRLSAIHPRSSGSSGSVFALGPGDSSPTEPRAKSPLRRTDEPTGRGAPWLEGSYCASAPPAS